jgi:hypothetical protein
MPADFTQRLIGNNVQNVITNLPQGTGAIGTPILPRNTFIQFLRNWETSIPLQSLWMVIFNPPVLAQAGRSGFDKMMEDAGEYVSGHKKHFESESAYKQLWHSKTGKDNARVGCAFAQSCNIPGESLEVDRIGFQNRGWLRDPVMKFRSPLQPFSCDFLETNVSFIDHILRPWLILASHRGFAARIETKGNPEGGKWGGMATDMVVVNFARQGTISSSTAQENNYQFRQGEKFNQLGMTPRKIWVFKDCVPIRVDNQNTKYGIDNDAQTRSVEFLYRRYQVYWPSEFLERKPDHIHTRRDGLPATPSERREPLTVRREHDMAKAAQESRIKRDTPSPDPSPLNHEIYQFGADDPGKGDDSHSGTDFIVPDYSNVIKLNGTTKDAIPIDDGGFKKSWGNNKISPDGQGNLVLDNYVEGVKNKQRTGTRPALSHTEKGANIKTTRQEVENWGKPGVGDSTVITREQSEGRAAIDYFTEAPMSKMWHRAPAGTGSVQGSGFTQGKKNISEGSVKYHLETYGTPPEPGIEDHESNAMTDWSLPPGVTVKANEIHDYIHGLGVTGEFEEGPVTGMGVTNMMNKKAPKEVKTGSGIFGLLGL